MSAAAEPRPAALRRQVARAVRWNALVPLKVAVSSAASLVLINALPKEIYGVVVLVTSLAGLIGTWLDFGIERSLPKFYPEIERDAGRAGLFRFIREIALFKLATVALLILGLLIAREPFFAFWADRASNPAVRAQLEEGRWWLFGTLVALLAFGAIFDVLMQVLIAYFRQKAFNLIGMATAIVQPLLLIGAVVFDLGLPGLLGSLVVMPVLAIALAWRAVGDALARVAATGGSGLRPGFRARLVRYALTNYGQQLAGMVHSLNFAVLFLGGLAAPAEFRVGYFLAAQALQILFAPLNGLQVPLFARLREEHDPAHTQATYGLLSRCLLLLFCPAAAGLAVLAPNLTHILWPQYSVSAPVAATMAICLFGASLLAVARNIVLVHEVYRPILVSRLVGLIAVPLLFWLPGHYGPLGAALAIGGASLLAEAVAWQWALRSLRLTYPWAFAARVLLACAGMVAVVWPLAAWMLPVPATLTVAERAGPALAGQLVIVALGGLAYLTFFRLLGGLDLADKAALAALRLPGTRHLLRLL